MSYANNFNDLHNAKIDVTLANRNTSIIIVKIGASLIIWTPCRYKIINLNVKSGNFLLLSLKHDFHFYQKCCTNRSMVRKYELFTHIWKLLYSPSMPQYSITPAILNHSDLFWFNREWTDQSSWTIVQRFNWFNLGYAFDNINWKRYIPSWSSSFVLWNL